MSDAGSRQSVRLSVQDWPSIGRNSTLSLDHAVVSNEADLLSYCRERFGEGRLEEAGEARYEYRRTMPLPRGIKWLLAFLLNKSY